MDSAAVEEEIAPRKAKVGVFLDVDNLFPYWLYLHRLEPATNYLVAADFTLVLDRIAALARAEGVVVTYEAYGHWANKARFPAASLMYHEYGYDLQHVPPLYREEADKTKPDRILPTSNLKNAGDILLASRAILAAVRADPSLETVIIGAADSDYQQLVIELKRLGMRVVCLSFPIEGQQRTLLASAYDDHLVLDPVARWVDLDKAQERPATGAVTKVPVERVAVPTFQAPNLVADALWTLLVSGAVPWPSLLRGLEVEGGIGGDDAGVVLMGLLSRHLVLLESLTARLPDAPVRGHWIPSVTAAVVDELVVAAYSSASGASTADRTAAARTAVLAKFRQVNPKLEQQVSAALAVCAAR